MGNNIDEIFNDKAFDSMGEERKAAFKQLYMRLQGKSVEESMMILMDFSRSMPKGQPITNAERDAMLNVVMEGLNDADKMKMKKILKMIGL